MGGRFFFTLIMFYACSLQAADVESLHTFNFNFQLTPTLNVQLHTRARTFEQFRTFNQFRVGPVVSWQAAKRLTLVAGYYETRQNTRVAHNVYPIRRPWIGGQFRLLQGRHWSLDNRTVVERFI
jgi:hypothetical protein